MNFEDLNLHPTLLKAVLEQGYTVPTPIQEQAIPLVLAGGDVLGCAQTGTGKTAAFALPILQYLSQNRLPLAARQNGRRPIRTLVLAPTRELALQIYESFVAYGAYTGMRATYIFGGVPQNPQVKALENGVDILVATPGRLLDLMSQNFIDLRSIEVFVLDEADRMLDMGFIHDIRKVVASLPRKRQTLLFSATLLPEIRELAAGMLENPKMVSVAPPASTVDIIEQSVHFVERADKIARLLDLLKNPDVDRALVFTRTKYGADKVVRKLGQAGILSAAIHGNKSQNKRQDALEGFKDGRLRVLVATDIAARGLDIDDVSHVFNLDLPFEPECYVHRIGRTARAGREGIAVSFCSSEERSLLTAIERMIRKRIPVVGPVPEPGRPTDLNAIRRNDRAERRADDISGESGKQQGQGRGQGQGLGQGQGRGQGQDQGQGQVRAQRGPSTGRPGPSGGPTKSPWPEYAPRGQSESHIEDLHPGTRPAAIREPDPGRPVPGSSGRSVPGRFQAARPRTDNGQNSRSGQRTWRPGRRGGGSQGT